MLAFSNPSSTVETVERRNGTVVHRTPDDEREVARVRYSITTEETTLAEGRTTVSPGEYKLVETHITSTGRYTFSLTVNDRVHAEQSWTVDEYDIRMGSNIIAAIGDDEVEFLIEE
jgi:hypothetical protein